MPSWLHVRMTWRPVAGTRWRMYSACCADEGAITRMTSASSARLSTTMAPRSLPSSPRTRIRRSERGKVGVERLFDRAGERKIRGPWTRRASACVVAITANRNGAHREGRTVSSTRMSGLSDTRRPRRSRLPPHRTCCRCRCQSCLHRWRQRPSGCRRR